MKPPALLRAAGLLVPDEKRTVTPFFAMLKDLTLMGYFTSEIGATQALEYVLFLAATTVVFL